MPAPPLPTDLRPALTRLLERFGLTRWSAGVNSTHPTYVGDEVVVKLFGGIPAWRRAFAAEHATLERLARDPAILAPRLLAAGWLTPDAWPYLVTARVDGSSLAEVALNREQRRALAAAVGEQVARVHALSPAGFPRASAWPHVDPTRGAAASSLPPHLVAQVAGFLERHPARGTAAVHADLTQTHAFVRDGRLVGLIDWGDAHVADPHTELIQVYRALLACDRELFATFLEASGWKRGPDFPQRTLAQGLRRQALGLAQHRGIDVFEPIAARLPLHDVPTLEALAEALFAGI